MGSEYESPHAHRLLDRGHATRVSDDFARLIEYWNLTIDAINDITETLGLASIYPFTVTGDVVAKLGFIHHQITKNAERGDVSRTDRHRQPER